VKRPTLGSSEVGNKIRFLFLALSVPTVLIGQSAPYTPPELLDERIRAGVASVAQSYARHKNAKTAASMIDSVWTDIETYAVTDAVVPGNDFRNLNPEGFYVYAGETARTDKQVGATATAGGSTSLAEKPGFPLLLSYAIEHGAIDKAVNGNSTTLSGSLYNLAILGHGGDTPQNFNDFNFWRRIGYSATINMNSSSSNSSTTNTTSNLLDGFNARQISEYSFKVRVLGDRSTRSKAFTDQKDFKTIMENVHDRLSTLVHSFAQLDAKEPALRKKADALDTSLVAKLQQHLEAAGVPQDDSDKSLQPLESDLYAVVLGEVAELVTGIRDESITISPETRTFLETQFVPKLAHVLGDLKKDKVTLENLIAEYNKSSLLTVEYTNHRAVITSAYSEFKLLYEHPVKLNPLKFDLVINSGLSFYNKPNPMLHESRTRDFSTTVSFEGSAKNFILAQNSNDLSKVTYSFNGRYERMRETKTDIAIAQFKLDVPISKGLSIPISVSYANHTEFIKEKEVRGDFGVTLDVDKLYALLQNGLK